MASWIKIGVCGVVISLGALACGGPGEGEEGTSKGSIDLDSFNTDGKGDLAKSTKLLDNVPPDASVKGRFDPRARTYGYVVEARKGAKLTINLEATAGKDAEGIEPGAELDMVYEIHGPFESTKNTGEKLVVADDTSDTDLSAPESTFEVAQDGKYFIAFTSFNDTGKGEYRLDIKCEGTDVQCMRPDFDKPCEEGRLFIQGATIEDNQTWGKCDVVVLENVTIAQDAQVTINPGVTVSGNFLGDEPFGNVHINVNGLLQAVGTPDAPIVFTSFVDDRGWGGLTFSSEGNRIEHAFIENARQGVRVASNASVNIDHAVIEGLADSRDQGHDTVGLEVLAQGDADLKHATIKNFQTGIRVLESELVSLTQSVVRENQRGIHVRGTGSRRNRCNTNTTVTPAPRPFDPKIDHSDIIHNDDIGIYMERDNVFIQITKSNIAHNGGRGVVFEGSALHEESFIRESNILRNNGATEEVSSVQVQSFHRQGNFDVSGNYWEFISDPNLSTTRNGCAEIIFTGFAPELIEDAGPTFDDLTTPVQQDTFQAEQTGK